LKPFTGKQLGNTSARHGESPRSPSKVSPVFKVAHFRSEGTIGIRLGQPSRVAKKVKIGSAATVIATQKIVQYRISKKIVLQWPTPSLWCFNGLLTNHNFPNHNPQNLI